MSSSSVAVRSRRVVGKMTRCLSQSTDAASRHQSGHQSALDTRSVRFPVTHDNYTSVCNDASRIVVSSGKDDDTLHPETLESESNGAARLSQNASSSTCCVCSAARCSMSKEQTDHHCMCICSRTMNHQNHDSPRGRDARTYLPLSRAPSTTKRCSSNRGSSVTWRKNHPWRSISGISFLFTFLLCTTICYGDDIDECSHGIMTPGRTWPKGDIYVEHGQNLTIYCILNMTYVEGYSNQTRSKNSSDIKFFSNLSFDDMYPEEYVHVINETTAMLHVSQPPVQHKMHYCKLDTLTNEQRKDKSMFKDMSYYDTVCLNMVTVGFKPEEPKNFTCISYNWESITCTWTPKENYIRTSFYLMMKFAYQKGNILYPCPKDTIQPTSCTWSLSTDPIYRQPYEQFTFLMNARNVLGEKNFTYRIDHFANVIPNPPCMLSVVNRTLTSALLNWDAPFPVNILPAGLHHKIHYQSQWSQRGHWKSITIRSHIHEEKKFYNLTNLHYANTAYDVRIYLKSAVASDTMWSNFSTITFRTLPRVPGRSPRTDIGSFEVINDSKRDVYLYWQPIPQIKENGNDFKYKVTCLEERGHNNVLAASPCDFQPDDVNRLYAKIKGIQTFRSYLFEITATNEVGANETSARIFVPRQKDMPPEPIAFTKVIYDNGSYELSWRPPIENNNITNYTIFWCENNRDHPYQCTNDLEWIHVSKDTTIWNKTLDPSKAYQFAISANTNHSSSGMIWASCTVVHNKVIGKMKSLWINRIGSYFMEIGWKLHCSDRISIVEGFKIYYCPIVSPFNFTCMPGSKLNKTIWANPHTIHGVIDHLKGYTTYLVTVAVLTKSGEGPQSDPLYNTTLEGAPSTSPQNVTITDVSNTTMSIEWKAPPLMNGVLRYYKVYYNEHVEKVEKNHENEGHVQLTNLLPYKNYTISVVACTVSCSERSPKIHQRTKIGMPGKINTPYVIFINKSQVSVNWTIPQEPGGPVHDIYYEILKSDDGFSSEIYNTTKTDIQVIVQNCNAGREYRYDFKIRAVNIAAGGLHLRGPWSDAAGGNCYNDGSFRVTVITYVISGVGVAAFVALVVYCSKRAWLKCQAMQDVEVKLPPGLASNTTTKLLKNDQHIRQPSADSSGCSSGQESVTSSLTADLQVSSDSGTEIDTVPASLTIGEKLLETSPSWESNSLRQRNVGTTRPNLAAQTAHWDAYVKVTKSGEPVMGETVSLARSTPNLTDSTGYTTSQHTWSSTGYISMPSSEESSNNPSPVPKENLNIISTGGGYSIIGTVPRSKGDASITDTIGDALIPIQPETKQPAAYMSALEQRPKENQQHSADAFCDIEKLSIIEPSKCTKLDALASYPTHVIFTTGSDKLYVQTGLMDTSKKPIALLEPTMSNPLPFSKNPTDTCGKPLVSFAINPTPLVVSNALSETISSTKPYVPLSSISEMTKSPIRTGVDKDSSSRKPYISNICMPTTSDNTSKPYVLASSIDRTLHQQQQDKAEPSVTVQDKNNKDVTQVICWRKLDSADEKKPASKLEQQPQKSILITKQKGGYVTISENPDLEQQSSPQTTTGQSTDDQYSKVTVVPSTIQ